MSVWGQIVADYTKTPKEPTRPKRQLTEKKCTGCGVVKPVSEFYARVDHSPGGTISKCKACYLIVQAKRREIEKQRAAYKASLKDTPISTFPWPENET